MKVGIITITEGANYGNRLQNYAMQILLEQMGIQVDTLRYRASWELVGISKLKFEGKCIIKRMLRYPIYDQCYWYRKKRFQTFNHKYIHFGPWVLYNNVVPEKLVQHYDCFLVGSDQVWNSSFLLIQEGIQFFLAMFAREKQAIAYAASFGTKDVLPEYREYFSDALPRFAAIGVRECVGVDIVKNLSARDDAKVVLDPTMMLTKEHWTKIEKKPNYIRSEKYIVTYFLGGKSKKIATYIEEVAKNYQAKIINLNIENLGDDCVEDKEIFGTTPDEFVWLLHHAECILTDSFHATVFSILFHKPFCTFERLDVEGANDMGSRIETLLSRFDLLRFYDDIENPKVMPETYDTESVWQTLAEARQESMEFLVDALDRVEQRGNRKWQEARE